MRSLYYGYVATCQWKECLLESLVSYVCIFVALDIQHAMGMRLIVICGNNRSTIFFHIIS